MNEPDWPLLTAREAQVATLLGRGWTTSQIAAAMEISEATIKIYMRHLKAKFGLRKQRELEQFLRGEASQPSGVENQAGLGLVPVDWGRRK